MITDIHINDPINETPEEIESRVAAHVEPTLVDEESVGVWLRHQFPLDNCIHIVLNGEGPETTDDYLKQLFKEYGMPEGLVVFDFSYAYPENCPYLVYYDIPQKITDLLI